MSHFLLSEHNTQFDLISFLSVLNYGIVPHKQHAGVHAGYKQSEIQTDFFTKLSFLSIIFSILDNKRIPENK